MRPSLGFRCSRSIYSLHQCFSTFLLQWNLPKMFALHMEPYAMIQVSILLQTQNCGCQFCPRQIRSEPLAVAHGIPVENHWPTYLQALLILIILNLTFWCRWSSVPLYHVCTTCWNWEISICPLTPWATLFTSFLISVLVPQALKCLCLWVWNHTYGVVKGAKQSLPLQLGFEQFQYISLY